MSLHDSTPTPFGKLLRGSRIVAAKLAFCVRVLLVGVIVLAAEAVVFKMLIEPGVVWAQAALGTRSPYMVMTAIAVVVAYLLKGSAH